MNPPKPKLMLAAFVSLEEIRQRWPFHLQDSYLK